MLIVFHHFYAKLLIQQFCYISEYTFEVGGKNKKQKQMQGIDNAFVVKDDIESGYLNVVPLWEFGLFLRFTARRIITYYRFYDVSVVVVVYFKGNASLLMTYLFHHVVEGIVGYVIVMSFYVVNGFIPLGCR